MKIFKLLSMVLIAIFISISFTACSNDKESVVPPVEDEYIDVPPVSYTHLDVYKRQLL